MPLANAIKTLAITGARQFGPVFVIGQPQAHTSRRRRRRKLPDAARRRRDTVKVNQWSRAALKRSRAAPRRARYARRRPNSIARAAREM